MPQAPEARALAPPPAGLARLLVLRDVQHLSLLYGATLLIGALLLFWVQPLFVKLVLPRYGGSPAVWTTASLFFQSMLLAGYVYAHVLTRRFEPATQVTVHLALLAAVFLVLPVGLAADAGESSAMPVASLLGVLLVGLGLPFFAIAATAPLMQVWFARTGHRDAPDPYFLYSASNIGSVVALVGYPALMESLLGLARQAVVWTFGFGLLATLIVACAANSLHHGAGPKTSAPAAVARAAPLTWPGRLRWMLLALAPSSLLLGVTHHITTDIAAVPLLWLVPLLLYVLTYVNAFARRPLVPHHWMLAAQPRLVVLLVLAWVLNIYLSVFVLHLVVFFVTAMMCHGELARARPDTTRLTEFYLWIAIGGALGAAFNALAAPRLFDTILEYPLALGLACMLRPGRDSSANAWRWNDIVFPLLLAAALGAMILASFHPMRHGAIATVIYLQAVGITLYLFHVRPVRFGLAVALIIAAGPALHLTDQVLERHRNFFGVHTVLRDTTGRFNVLMHGIAIHGAQHTDPTRQQQTITYYHRESAIGELFRIAGPAANFDRVAVVGMGTGTLACYRAEGRTWTFFEIDPRVIQTAQDPRLFSYFERCAPDARVVVGDGRLSLARMPDRSFDLIVIDTFSSDAIPMHMITREALALYQEKIAPSGVIMFHITNQYLDLVPQLAALAADAGLTALTQDLRIEIAPTDKFSALLSSWIALTRDPDALKLLETREYWVRIPDSGRRLWTDDYSNLLDALK